MLHNNESAAWDLVTELDDMRITFLSEASDKESARFIGILQVSMQVMVLCYDQLLKQRSTLQSATKPFCQIHFCPTISNDIR